MKKRWFVMMAIALGSIVCLCGCNSHSMPDDFNIAFQFGEKSEDTITLDTYNKVMTRGTGYNLKKVKCTVSKEDMRDIYDKLIDNRINSYKGEYKGLRVVETPNVQFSVKYTVRGRSGIASGDGTTASSEKKRDINLFIEFRDYMEEYIKGRAEYKQLMG